MTTHEPGGRSSDPAIPAHHTTTSPAPLRLSGAAQLLAVLPQLLGYRLERSIVVVVTGLDPVTSMAEMTFTGRVDLPETEHLDEALQRLRFAVQQAADAWPGVTLLAVYGIDLPQDESGEVQPRATEGLLSAAQRLAEETGTHVHELMLVRDGSRELCRVIDSGDHVEAPLRRWEAAPQPQDVPVAADLVLRGRSALPSRSALAASVRRRDEAAARASAVALAVLDLAPERIDLGHNLSALGEWVVCGEEPSARDRAAIALMLHDREVRDAVLARWLPELDWVDVARTPEDLVAVVADLRAWPATAYHEGLDRLLVLVSRVPYPLGGPLLTLAAMVAWTRGDGTLANEACDLALEIDPASTLAGLLRQALDVGLRPPRGKTEGRAARRSGGRPAA